MGKFESIHSLQSKGLFRFVIIVMSLIILCSNIVIGKQYIIRNVPYFSQQTEYSCGATSLQMALSYFDGNFHRQMKEKSLLKETVSFRIISQESIVDVARTSNHTGTCSLDVIRSARFSTISSTPISQYYLQYPKQAPMNGWFGIENSHNLLNKSLDSIYYFGGLMSMYYPERDSYLKSEKCSEKKGGEGNVKCWAKEMIESFLKFDIPVICLMFYDLNDSEGHYRLAVGYETKLDESGNEIPTHIIMWDPYNREGNPPISNFTISEFCNLWNYTELRFENTCYRPYFGAVMYPLDIKAMVSREGHLMVEYGHPKHLVSSDFVSKHVEKTLVIDNVVAKIRIYQTIPNQEDILKEVESVDLQMNPSRLNFGQNLSFSWKLPANLLLEKNIRIKIGIYGLVCDKTLTWLYEPNTDKFSQSYKYCDQVGGTIFIKTD